MSKVDSVLGVSKCSRKGVLKLLSSPEGWELHNRGQDSERFVHESGWRFYTGVDLCTFRNDDLGVVFDTGIILTCYFSLIGKEKKFIKEYFKYIETKGG